MENRVRADAPLEMKRLGKAITWILNVFVHFGDIRHKADGKESGCRNFVQLSTEDVLGEMILFMAPSKSEVIGIYTIWKNFQRFGPVFTWEVSPGPSCQTERMNLSSAWMERFCWTKCHDFQAEKLKLKPVMLEKVPVPSGNVARNCFLGSWSWENTGEFRRHLVLFGSLELRA